METEVLFLAGTIVISALIAYIILLATKIKKSILVIRELKNEIERLKKINQTYKKNCK